MKDDRLNRQSAAKRVLVVDDNANVLFSISMVLRRKLSDWDMLLAGSGQEALALMEDTEVDVILSDLQMPGMNGLELLREVKSRYPSTARLMFSAYLTEGLAVEARQLTQHILDKPFDVNELAEVIGAAGNK